MSKTITDEQAKAILDALTKQSFFDFYTKDFESYLMNETGCPSEEAILKEIKELFYNLNR